MEMHEKYNNEEERKNDKKEVRKATKFNASRFTGKKKKKDWIAGAVDHPGSFTKEADRAHKGVHAFAEKERHASGKIGDRARLALTFEKMRR